MSQRTVLELFSGSESTQLVKASTRARVEVEISAKKLPSHWTSLLFEEMPLANQEVSVALSIEKSNTARISGSLTQNPSMLRTLVARLSGVEEKIMKEIRSGSSEKGCGRGRRA